MRWLPKTLYLIAELAVLMVGVPLLLWLALPSRAILPVMWLMAVLCHILSRARGDQPWAAYWNWAAVTRANLWWVVRRFLLCAALMAGATYALKPELLFGFVRTMPLFWALVMVLYPLISVVPQEIIFRRYVFARHGSWLKPKAMLLVSGLGFGFAHVVFGNWVAPVLCALGGLLFAHTYQRTHSLALVAIEHALYGDFLFTLGLGRYFYHGAVGAA